MTLQQYRAALAAHDWYFEYSDDYRVWAEGKRHKATLREGQREHDQTFAIWNEYAPPGMKVEVKS